MTVPETVPKPIVNRTGDVLGYARVSTADQDAASQHDRLAAAGAIRIFTDTVSGASSDRPELARLIGQARPGDSLCVTRLDRLGRSLAELLATVGDLRSRGIHLSSLEERIDTSSAAGAAAGPAGRRSTRRRLRRCASWWMPA